MGKHNLEILNNGIISMDSREIAELTGKTHSNILVDIRKQLKELNINPLKYQSVYMGGNNQERIIFKLDYDQTMILVSGYSIFLRAKIVRRWTELENNFEPEPPTQLQLAEQVVVLLKEREDNKEKITFFNTVTQIDSWLTFKEVANMLNIPKLGRNNLTKKLRELKYINNYNKPYQKYIDQKLFKVIETLKGLKMYTSTVVSQKGLDRLIKVLNNGKSPILGLEE